MENAMMILWEILAAIILVVFVVSRLRSPKGIEFDNEQLKKRYLDKINRR